MLSEAKEKFDMIVMTTFYGLLLSYSLEILSRASLVRFGEEGNAPRQGLESLKNQGPPSG